MNYRFLFFSITALLFVGCNMMDSKAEQDKNNFQFISGTVGQVVLDYKKKMSTFPDTFSEALSQYGKTLPNRGDYYGRGLGYYKISDDEFLFVSDGANNQFDSGKVDDLVVVYFTGQWKMGNEKDVKRAMHATTPDEEKAMARANKGAGNLK